MESRVKVQETPTSQATVDPKAPEVQRHFDVTAEAFDSIYTGHKSALRRWLDRTLRKDMFERFELTLREIRRMEAARVLDVGCGSGLFSIAMAREGVQTVVGVDFSKPMIDLAVQRAAAAGVSSKCEFIVGDFLQMGFSERFDGSIAIGVFDYLAEPGVFLKRLREVTTRKIIATFPCKWTYRAPIRKIRLGILKCPVY